MAGFRDQRGCQNPAESLLKFNWDQVSIDLLLWGLLAVAPMVVTPIDWG